IPLAEKLRYIERLAKHFTVFSEVGRKDRTHVVAPKRWVDQIKSEIAAGSWKVIVEGRESGTVGIYHSSGEIKAGLIDEIQMQVDPGRIIFEAPRKPQQVWFIKHFGPNVNMGNVPPQDVISLETIRQGLRADTLLLDHDGRTSPPAAERGAGTSRALRRHEPLPALHPRRSRRRAGSVGGRAGGSGGGRLRSPATMARRPHHG